MSYKCKIQSVECMYATCFGNCMDNIYKDYGLCELQGDEMPNPFLSGLRRREEAMKATGGSRC